MGGGKYKTVSILLMAAVLLAACRDDRDAVSSNPDSGPQQTERTPQAEPNAASVPQAFAWPHPRSDERLDERKAMVNQLEHYYGLDDKKVLDAMVNVPRHWFVPDSLKSMAYVDGPLPIGYGQTISQPFIVAYMTELLNLDANDIVLEVGTGSGYQAAVLSELTPHIFSIEIVEPLAEGAADCLSRHGYNTIQVKSGDGYLGWPEHAPFDAIIVTCAPDQIPSPLLEQLAPGGRIIIPVGDRNGIQELFRVTKDRQGKISKESMIPVRFVPLVREPEG